MCKVKISINMIREFYMNQEIPLTVSATQSIFCWAHATFLKIK